MTTLTAAPEGPRLRLLTILSRHPLVCAAVVLLMWTLAVRLPFAHIVDDDEAFFSLVAARWQMGELPYAASFDVKPPLLFLFYVLANLLTGGGLPAIKGLEIAFVAWGAWALFRLASAHGSRGAAIWAAGLYPIYSLTLRGFEQPNLLIQLPFVIMAFDSALRAREDGGIRQIALCGFLMGCAGLIKQTAVFEAVAAMLFLAVALPKGARLKGLTVFVMAALTPCLVFLIYFWMNGALQPAFDDVVWSAVGRLNGDVAPVPGLPSLSLMDGFTRFFPCLKSLYALVWLALLVALRYRRPNTTWPRPLLLLCALWLAAAGLVLFSLHSAREVYAQDFIAPLLIVSGIMVTQGFAITGRHRLWGIAACVIAAIAVPAFTDRGGLWFDAIKGRNDPVAVAAVATELNALGVRPGDRLFVPNRGLMVYVATRTVPAARVYHPLQVMCAFPTPDARPLTKALTHGPSFVVVADTRLNMACETAAKHTELSQALARDYEKIKTVTGKWDSFTIYRRKP
jgi:hypothetical protein